MDNDQEFSETGSLASSFKGRSTAKSSEELRKARETRGAEALRMKDEQLKILTEQNANLLSSLDKIEDEANTIQMEKLAIEQENRSIRDNNFELQTRARAAETQAKRMAIDVSDKEKQIRILTDQNSELYRLLQSEEGLTTQLQSEVAEVRAELEEIRQKYGALLRTAKTHEELATKAAREGQLRAEEIRILRAETEQLKQQNAELTMKTQVELEALQEQLRVRKEKQYQLLEKLQAQEEAKRQAEDQVAGMEEQLRGLHARNVEFETQLQIESRTKQNLEETNKDLQLENTNLFNQNKDLQAKIEKSERERIRMEAEARDSADKLGEMAEKVFQLLERLKLAELGKNKAMEALKKKEQDMVALQKKNARLIKEATEEARSRAKAELDVKVLQDQVRALKKNNQEISKKSKDESTLNVKLTEESDQQKETIKTLESRLSFLLNKVEHDEESRVIQTEDRKKLEAQVMSFTEKCEELHRKLAEMGESNRVIAQAMRLKQEELTDISTKYEILKKEVDAREAQEALADAGGENMQGAKPGGPDDIENVRLNEGKGRFYVEAKSLGGGSILILRGRKPLYREWLDKHNANEFLKRSQKTNRFRDMIVEKIGNLYGLLMVEEEDRNHWQEESKSRDEQIDHLQKKLSYMQTALATEEDAKRRMLLRYIHMVKEHALSNQNNMNITGSVSVGGEVNLPESNITDEEVHALAALLRNNTTITTLNLRSNKITDDGARALAAVLAGKSSLQSVDLKGNKISKGAIRIIAEALERAERVKHVYVHAGGKIEALGINPRWANPRFGETSDTLNGTSTNPFTRTGGTTEMEPRTMATVETVCVVDIRENNPEGLKHEYELRAFLDGGPMPSTDPSKPPTFQPSQMLETYAPPSGAIKSSKSEAMMMNSMNSPPRSTTPSSKLRKTISETSFPEKQPQTQIQMSQSAEIIEIEKKKQKLKLHELKALAVKELAWQGRSGGLDSGTNNTLAITDGGFQTTTTTIPTSSSSSSTSMKQFNKNKKNLQRVDLPPLTDVGTGDLMGATSNQMQSRGSSRGGTANGANGVTGGLGLDSNLQGYTSDTSVGKKKKKKNKESKVEKKLLESSPFAQALVPR